MLREQELLKRFRAGDVGALEIVYSRCVDYVTRIAAGVLRVCATGSARGSGEIAAALADVVQEVFMKAFAPDARRRFDEDRPYEPYLGQIARNVAIDHWRQMRRYVPSDLEQIIEKLSFEDAETSPRNEWSEPDTIAVVERYLASLDGETRRVHDALYVKGMSQREAAAVLGLGRQVIRSKEAKLRRELRRELSRAERAIPLPFRSAVSKETG
jgi:RNA polymerase sigma factor (sigma-70 family)